MTSQNAQVDMVEVGGGDGEGAEETPQHFLCPITFEIMKDPVIDNDGVSYERAAIEEWLNNGNSTSPTTQKALSVSDLRPNRALREAIEKHLGIETTLDPVAMAAALSSESAGADATASSGATDADPGAGEEPANNQASSSSPEVDLGVRLKYDGEYMLVSVVPPESPHAVRSSICCVVDVSGSMGSEATVQDENGKKEAFGLSVLDVTKHALKTIVKSLSPQDELSLVTFSSEVKVVNEPVLMTEAAARDVLEKIDRLQPDAMTNLWGGLHKGLELLTEKKPRSDNVAIFLLTDGLPNVSPGKGEAKALETFKNNNKGLPCRVHTFGFGYEMNSVMLSDLSSLGGGCYSFIPDSSFVGTVFVNAVANHITTAAHTLTLEVNGKNVVMGGGDHEAYPSSGGGARDDQHLSFQFGSIQFGQSKDVVFPLKAKQTKTSVFSSASASRNAFLEVTLKYSNGHAKKSVEKTYDWDSAPVENDSDIRYHRLRLALVKGVRDMMEKSGLDFNYDRFTAKTLHKAQKYAIEVEKRMRKLVDDKEERSLDLMKDFSGQISEAFSKDEFFMKWGVHFSLSISVAHLFQFCNNFKDPGVQHYCSELFTETRDRLDNIFITLPAPKPSIPITQATAGRRGNSGVTRTAGPVNMQRFMNMRGGCFHGNSVVHLSGQKFCRVDSLKKGDKVITGEGLVDEIECVLKTVSDDKSSPIELCRINQSLITTPWHPIRDEHNHWRFPAEMPDCEQITVYTNQVFTFLLKSRGTVLIGDVECATLAHGLTGPVIGHEFLGEESVARDLKRFDDFESGLVTVRPENFKRDSISGRIVALA